VASTKERIMETTGLLFQRYGYTGTGLKQIVAAADAPFGSIYHHFPNGKAQLGEEVIRRSGQMYKELFEAIFDAAPDVETATGDFFLGAAETLRQTDYADACPIETVFESWIAAGTQRLSEAGIPADEARRLTIVFISVLEGAFVLCRATKTTEALEVAGTQMAAAVREALTAAA
jgi:AcrR family transcriptional regulator